MQGMLPPKFFLPTAPAWWGSKQKIAGAWGGMEYNETAGGHI